MAFDKKKFKDAMRLKRFTQKDLAEEFGVDMRTVNRWLDPKYPIPSDKVRDLCFAINQLPNDFDPDWEGSVENQNVARVSAKVSSASKNGYWLMKKKYGVSETELVELAPTLFAMFAAALYEGTNKGDNEQRKLAVEILAKEFGLIPEHEIFPPPPDEIEQLQQIEDAIANGEIFGHQDDNPYSYNENSFGEVLARFSEKSSIIALPKWFPGSCPTSRGTAFDIKLINEISGNDPEISEAISHGEIELFSREF